MLGPVELVLWMVPLVSAGVALALVLRRTAPSPAPGGVATGAALVAGLMGGGLLGGLPGGLAGAMGALLLTSLLAALRPVAPPDGPRVAELRVRRVEDHVPVGLLRGLRVAGAVAALLAVLGAVLDPRDPRFADVPPGEAGLLVGLAVLIVAGTETAARVVVRSRRPARSGAELAADDALRASRTRAVVGSGLGLALLLVGTASWRTGVAVDLQLLRWVLPVAALAALLGAPLVWASTVRRP